MLDKNKKTEARLNYFSREDIDLFKWGLHTGLYEKLGAHPAKFKNKDGFYFSVWAPHAKNVSVIGSFNRWNKNENCLALRKDHSGIWEGFVEGVKAGDLYKFYIGSSLKKYCTDKADPFAFHNEIPPNNASIVWDLSYRWNDKNWMHRRNEGKRKGEPISVYEVHLGSWRKRSKEGFLSYRELAQELVPYVKQMGFTHVEILPIMEHPFYGSWGYQTLGYFSPSARYGTPQDFMYLIDCFHQNNIGVILDWVPSHFPSDKHGLAMFDGTFLYEYDDIHPDWNSNIFNIGKNQVVAFLISSALFWLKKYHIDGIRVDAVASMLYLNYSRQEGKWTPNFFGGYENLESIAFLRRLNQEVEKNFPDVYMMAEESTAWNNVSRPVSNGGLNFDLKWNMGWMHDTLRYFSKDYRLRRKNPNEFTFSLLYAFNENFILPFSHDEVVHLKKSLLGKMPGKKNSEKLSNLRALYGYLYAHPGKKLLFMGAELAEEKEWNHDGELQWDLIRDKRHQGIWRLIKALNKVYCAEKSLWEFDFSSRGFEWVDLGKKNNAVFSFMRKSESEEILVVCNLSNTVKQQYELGISKKSKWKVAFNTDDVEYGGRGLLKDKIFKTVKKVYNNQNYLLTITLPALSVIYLKRQ